MRSLAALVARSQVSAHRNGCAACPSIAGGAPGIDAPAVGAGEANRGRWRSLCGAHVPSTIASTSEGAIVARRKEGGHDLTSGYCCTCIPLVITRADSATFLCGIACFAPAHPSLLPGRFLREERSSLLAISPPRHSRAVGPMMLVPKCQHPPLAPSIPALAGLLCALGPRLRLSVCQRSHPWRRDCGNYP